jgi:hypothetical protein
LFHPPLGRRIEEKRRALEARIAALRAKFQAEAKEMEIVIAEERARDKVLHKARESLRRHRDAGRQTGKSSRKDRAGKSSSVWQNRIRRAMEAASLRNQLDSSLCRGLPKLDEDLPGAHR